MWSPDASRLYYLPRTGDVSGARTVSRAVASDGQEDELWSTANLDVVNIDVRTKERVTIAATAANESEPAFSPDGRYLAFQSDEPGRVEIFVPSGDRWQVTTGGGVEPRWTSGGRELLYRNGATIFAVPITRQPFSAGTPQTLFTVPNPNFVLITGWFEELKAMMRPTR